jgi:predicted MFS family arabinose efflux permease
VNQNVSKNRARETAKLAFRFVLIFGFVNLFADMTYEGARSIAGPFLGSLGASAAVVGFIAGCGEMAGFGLRSVFGYFADKTRQYWAFAFVGYSINMLAVPALALAGNWPVAAALMVSERTGRAIRRPAVEAMLSRAGTSIGHGWVFGLNEALDQTGATFGPLITAYILYRRGGYHHAFAALLISALLSIGVLAVAFFVHRRSDEPEGESIEAPAQKGFSRAYWFFVAAGALTAAGFADFSLIAFHFQKSGAISPDVIPIFYSVAMATGAFSALALGKLLDKYGLRVVLFAFGLAAFFAPLVFLNTPKLELAGMVLWGVGMGAQDSCLKAILSTTVHSRRRSTAFGVFDTGFGMAWFAGSAAMGILYERSIPALVIFSVVSQLLALPLFVVAERNRTGELV